MKKVLYLFLAVTFVGFSTISCSSDDDKGGSSSIIGSWEFYQEGFSIGDQELVLEDYEHTEGCSKDYIEFKSNGTATDFYFEESNCEQNTDSASYVVSGNNITVTYQDEGEDETISGKYEIRNNVLTLKISETYMGVTYNTVTTLKRK